VAREEIKEGVSNGVMSSPAAKVNRRKRFFSQLPF